MKLEYVTVVVNAIIYLKGVSAARDQEYGTYTNPNPRAYEQCGAQDLIDLSSCCNDVLSKLDDCKADDLACECCALQSMKKQCYNLCPGNPSANFLTVLFEDCASLQDVNACGLPFKKEDEESGDGVKDNGKIPFKSKAKNFELANEESESSVTVKSKIQNNLDKDGESATKVDILVDSKRVDDILDPHTSDSDSQVLPANTDYNNSIFNVTTCDETTSGSSHVNTYSIAYSILAVSLGLFVYEIL